MAVLGIDPGLKGALALVSDAGVLVETWDMPVTGKLFGKGLEVNPAFVADLVDEAIEIARAELSEDIRACVERVGPRPGQGVTSMFGFGVSFGMLRGVLAARQVPTTYAQPQRWKRFFGLDGRKEGARTYASEQWPAQAHRFRRVKDDGRAEAALIALYSVRNSG